MKVVLIRLFRWLKKQKVRILFFIWPLSPKADALMKRIGDGEIYNLSQIKPREVLALVELIDRKLIEIN